MTSQRHLVKRRASSYEKHKATAMNQGSEIAAYIDRLKRLLGVSSDMALADKIGVPKQNIANWRRRGNIPYAVEIRLADQFGPDAAFSKLTKFTADRREDAVLYGMFSYVWCQYNPGITPKDGFSIEWCNAFSALEDTFRSKIREIGFKHLNADEVYAVLRRKLRDKEVREVDFMFKIYVTGEISDDVDAFLNEGLEGLGDG